MKFFVILFSIILVLLFRMSFLLYKSRKELDVASKERDDAVKRKNAVMEKLWYMRLHYISVPDMYKWVRRAERGGKISTYEIKNQIWGELEAQKIRHWISTGGTSKRES